jgi:hypothetical protein
MFRFGVSVDVATTTVGVAAGVTLDLWAAAGRAGADTHR